MSDKRCPYCKQPFASGVAVHTACIEDAEPERCRCPIPAHDVNPCPYCGLLSHPREAATMSIKNRDHWTPEDMLDFIDGWHEASGLGFKTKRDKQRPIERGHGAGRHTIGHAVELMALGRTAREEHRKETGL